MPAYLEIWRPSGPELVALTGPRITIGKADSNTVVLTHDRTVSRLHAILEDYGAGWSVRDLGSRNGTFVNGEQIHTERALHSADEVRVGHSRMVFRGEQLTGDALSVTAAPEPAPELTRRERDVLDALCRPLFCGEAFPQPASTRRIASELVITDAAVKQHLLNLYDKFGILAPEERRVALAKEAIQRGAVNPANLRRQSAAR
ncbi:FHA domain-containing protein [Geodermatophilus sp. SYSU D00965]